MISSTSIAGISASQPRPNVLAGPETAYRPPPQSLDGMSDDGNMTQAQMDRIVAEKASQHVSYGFQIPSETLDRVRAEGREPTMAELDKIHEETKEISFALHGFVKAGIADPLTAAREAVAKTRAQQFDSRQSALSDERCHFGFVEQHRFGRIRARRGQHRRAVGDQPCCRAGKRYSGHVEWPRERRGRHARARFYRQRQYS